MLSGTSPFNIAPEDSHEEIIKKLNSGELNLDSKIWNYVSNQAKDLIKRMLTFDARSRPSATSVLGHSWIVDGKKLPEQNLAAMISSNSNNLSKAVGQSISIVSNSRSKGTKLKLQNPMSSGLFNRRMKGKIPSALKL
jgi:serine/threonine protein kinase